MVLSVLSVPTREKKPPWSKLTRISAEYAVSPGCQRRNSPAASRPKSSAMLHASVICRVASAILACSALSPPRKATRSVEPGRQLARSVTRNSSPSSLSTIRLRQASRTSIEATTASGSASSTNAFGARSSAGALIVVFLPAAGARGCTRDRGTGHYGR